MKITLTLTLSRREREKTKTMYISAFPTLSFRQMVSLKKGCLARELFPEGRSFFYFRGANAVYQAIKYLHIGVNDHVLMPSFHCGVEVEAVLKAKTNVHFYKMKENLEVDLQDLEGRIGPDTKAIFVIHYFGFPQKMDEIKRLCQKYKLLLIEDCAHALYSRYKKVDSSVILRSLHEVKETKNLARSFADAQDDSLSYLGSFGDVSIFSLQKSLPICDGGALLINQTKGMWKERPSQPNLMTTLRGMTLLRIEHIKMFTAPLYGLIDFLVVKPARFVLKIVKKSGSRSLQVSVPSSAYFDLSQSSKGMSAFSRKIADSVEAESLVKIRRKNYQYLVEAIKNVNGVQILFPSLAVGVCPLFLPIKVSDRGILKNRLEKAGVKTFIFGEFLHQNLERGFDPLAEAWSRHILCLPVHQDLTQARLDFIARCLKESIR